MVVGHGPGRTHVGGLLASTLVFTTAGLYGNTVGPDLYTFGSHAGAIYNAEAAKTKFFPATIQSALPSNPAPVKYYTARPQDTPDPPPYWWQSSLVSGPQSANPSVQFLYARSQDDPNQVKGTLWQWSASPASYTLLGTYIKGVPQTDPTQPAAVVIPKAAGGSLPANPSIRFIQGAPQVDLTPASSVRTAIPNPPVIAGRLTAQLLMVPPQADPTQMQPQFFDISVSVPGGTGVGSDMYTMGTHSAALYNAEAAKIDFWQPLNEGAVVGGVVGSEYLFGTHAGQIYDAEVQKTVVWQAVEAGPILPGAITAPEYLFGTHAVATYNAEAVKSMFAWRTTPLPQGVIVSYHEAAPQIADYNLPSQDFRSTLQQPANTQRLTLKFSGPQLVDLTIQPQIRGTTFTTPPTPPPILRRTLIAGPQLVDLTLSAQVWHPPMRIPPAVVQLRTIAAGPQQVDLTLQPTFIKQVFAVPLVPIVPLPLQMLMFAMPQAYDYTAELGAKFFHIGFVPFVIGIQPTVPNWGGRVVLSPKKLGENILLPVDFISRLGVGETILAANVTCSLYSGTDPNAASMPIGPAQILGTVVQQFVQKGIVGTTYELLYAIVTSAGQNLSLSGYFTVIPDLP